MADLLLTLLAKDELSSVFGGAAGAVTAFAKSLVEMTKQAAESEKIQAQLKLAAGQYTDALKDQAQAMSAKLGVDDDTIMRMQTILARFGEAPGKIAGTTKAILDYAAATGKDAVQATEDMVKAADKGTGSIKSMGVSFETTGNFAGDLEKATAAVGKRFHNGAETNADTLVGQINAAKVAIEDLGKVFGGVIAGMIKDSGALETSTKWLRAFSFAAQKGKAGTFLGASALSLLGSEAGARITEDAMEAADAELQSNNKAAGLALASGVGENRETKKGSQESTSALQKKLDEEEKIEKAHFKVRAAMYEEAARREDAAEAEFVKQLQDEAKQIAEDDEEKLRKQKERNEKAAHLAAEAAQKQAREMQRQEEYFARAGDQLGQGFVNAFVAQVSQLAQGGEFDVGGFFGQLFEGIFSFAASLIPGVGFLEGMGRAAVSGIGRLASGGIRAAQRAGRHHDGGWIERFHGGGWPAMGGDEQPAILQTGERVLSRREVSRMGGQSGVDRAAQGGGGGLTVVVNAVDQESVRGLFEGRGGRAMRDAVRLGRGPIGQLIKAGGY